MSQNRVGGIPVVDARAFNEMLKARASLVVLIVSSDIRMMHHIECMKSIKTEVTACIVGVDASDAHLIPVARVPKLMLFKNGMLTGSVQLTYEVKSLEDALRNWRFL